ncbi:MAG: hypothetical protein FIB04_14625 [Gammaproteobacteria bacterium]|nr:hypothetical protein [Gammaproteobacteria bacterium]
MLPVRRITSGFRDVRWGHVFIELVLLIVGILIALAVNGWMEDRRDARTERQYLEALVRDLDRDVAILNEFGALHESQTADGVMAYRALRRGPGVEDKEAVAQALSRLMSRRTLRLTHATYANLVGTGNIRLVRNAALRERIVGLYESNERWATIIDRNNQVFVDQMYMQYIMDRGLIAPRPTGNIPVISAAFAGFAERVDMPVDSRNDRLWRLPADSPEWDVLTGKVWYRTLTSYQAINQAREVTRQVLAVRDAVADELARRWPDSQTARPAG